LNNKKLDVFRRLNVNWHSIPISKDLAISINFQMTARYLMKSQVIRFLNLSVLEIKKILN